MKALVVDKSDAMRSILGRMLSMRGIEVAEAENGSRALEVLRDMGSADLVLASWMPREMENLDFITTLRRHTAHAATVIMLAAYEPGMRELHNALMAGADGYLTTPFTSIQMDEKLEQLGFVVHRGKCLARQSLSCR
jgi:DNA-binding response OmpR family regulator